MLNNVDQVSLLSQRGSQFQDHFSLADGRTAQSAVWAAEKIDLDVMLIWLSFKYEVFWYFLKFKKNQNHTTYLANVYLLKLRYCEKATKFEKISQLL